MALSRRGLLPLLRGAQGAICSSREALEAAAPSWRRDDDSSAPKASSSSMWAGFSRGEAPREGAGGVGVWPRSGAGAHAPAPPARPGFASEVAAAKPLDLSPCDKLSVSPTSAIL